MWLAKLSGQFDTIQATTTISSSLQQFNGNGNGNGNSIQTSDLIQTKLLNSYFSFLTELDLLAKTRQLFSEDLKLINVMLGQLVASTIKLSQQQQQQQQSPLRLSNRPSSTLMQDNFEDKLAELFQRLLALTSSLYEPIQRLAWLDLPNVSEIRMLESQLMQNLRLFGQLVGSTKLHSLQTISDFYNRRNSHVQLKQIWSSQRNLWAELVTLNVSSLQPLAVIQQQQQQQATNSINSLDQQQSIVENYLTIGETMASNEDLIGSELDMIEFRKLKLHSPLFISDSKLIANNNFNGKCLLQNTFN